MVYKPSYTEIIHRLFIINNLLIVIVSKTSNCMCIYFTNFRSVSTFPIESNIFPLFTRCSCILLWIHISVQPTCLKSESLLTPWQLITYFWECRAIRRCFADEAWHVFLWSMPWIICLCNKPISKHEISAYYLYMGE